MTELLVFAAVFMASYAVLTMLFWRSMRLRERVLLAAKDVAQKVIRDETVAAAVSISSKKAAFSFSFSEAIKKELDSVGVSLTPKEMQLVVFLCSTIVVLGGIVFHGILGMVMMLGLLAIWYRFWLLHRRKIRQRDLENGLCDMLTIASGALRAGYSFLQTVDILSQETKGRLAEEFRRMLREMSLGVSIEEALAHADNRIKSLDFSLIVSAILIQRQVGGNLAQVLEIAGETIRERVAIQGEIRTLTAQGRLSMWIFMALTPCIGLLLFMFNGSYMEALWSSPTGFVMLFTALLGQVVGISIIRKIVNIEI